MLSKILNTVATYYRRKKQRLTEIKISKPTYVHDTATFVFHKKITIGRYCRIGHECHIDGEGGVSIGDGTILASRVVILSSSHVYKQDELLPYKGEDELMPVHIGKGCWIGWGAMIKPGINIGDGAIVAMGSVVTKNVEAGQVVAGNPAVVVNKRDDATNIQQMISEEKFFLKNVLQNNYVREKRKTNIKNHLLE